ncbi:GntR family transcriptional regulator [Paracoccus kondratievae]|uniref:GntR family transcriptional regulator n=1 Tax=Paracoccus kondratievae TaxID=135740 RepID=A0AAD3RSW0_9RHOB|nr:MULTISPECIES: GntR family transcriptional regulator [Paracoccus]QFQ86069.1 GntR family transcriptional regulator [Paracoccus kondratievae]GLK62969.1 GntR family transcriptional regulator [Paracoccus kondratievae]SMG35781.1 transcriptional regulator, GntR family [Paracoccus sp. J56]
MTKEPAAPADSRDSSLSLAEGIAARLRDQVTGGTLVPGQRLSEARLAAELEISRNTLREVFRLLTREGILRHEPNRGVFVAVPSMASILDIYRVRRLIEVPALAQAWPGHAAVTRMHNAVEQAKELQKIPDWRGVGSANMEFHAAIVALTDSPRLIQFFTQIIAELRLAFGLLDSPELLHQPYIPRNAEILGKLERGDPAAAARMLDDYLNQSERAVLEAFARLG